MTNKQRPLFYNLQLKMMAAEAPITPKKPAYTGLASLFVESDILNSLVRERLKLTSCSKRTEKKYCRQKCQALPSVVPL